MVKMERMTRIKLFWLIILIILWEITGRIGLVDSLILPAFSTVLVYLVRGLAEGYLILQLLQSVGMVILGLFISVVLGTVMNYLDYFHPVAKGLFEVLSSIFHPLPGIALLPVVVLWVGVGMDAVLVIIIHAVLWSYYLNVKSGYQMIDKSLIEAARNNGATNIQLFRYVLLPGSKRSIATGLRIGWSRGWRGLISAEMVFGAISALGGIGWFMFERRAFGDIKGTYAGIVLVAIVGVLVEQVIFKHSSEAEE